MLPVFNYLLYYSLNFPSSNYLGFSEIMGTLAKLGFFDTEAHPMLKDIRRPTFRTFLGEILKTNNDDHSVTINDDEMARRIISLRHSEEPSKAMKTIKTIKYELLKIENFLYY